MLTAYIETTIPSYYCSRPARDVIDAARQFATRNWWDSGCSGFELWTSAEVIEEISRGNEAQAALRREMMKDVRLLTLPPEVAALAGELLAARLIPARAAADAMHIAIACFHGIDHIVTWNFKHIANPFIYEKLRETVRGFGFLLPTMSSPEQLLQNDETYDFKQDADG